MPEHRDEPPQRASATARPQSATGRPLSRDAEYGDADGPSSVTTFADEDFLFHLYRGSELLQDNCVPEAKEELERALSMRPRDVEGQGLLGVVYFRLGLYPRAIEIYEGVIRDVPRDVTPRVNLALCYLKTGQLLHARESLEEVLRLHPDHGRAWGYLGLVFERLGDYEKAQAAFERAGQPHMARRVQQVLDEQLDTRVRNSALPDGQEVRQVAADAVEQLERETRTFTPAQGDAGIPLSRGRWREPGQESFPALVAGSEPAAAHPVAERRALPPPPVEPAAPLGPDVARCPSELAARVVVHAGPSGAARAGAGAVAVRSATGLVVRAETLLALSAQGALRHSAVMRRGRGGEDLDEPLGAAGNPFVMVHGPCEAALVTRGGELPLTLLGNELFFIREERLVAFEAQLRFESGRLPSQLGERPPLVQLSGDGVVVFECRRTLRSIRVSSDAAVLVRAQDLIGWTGRLLPRTVPLTEAPGSTPGLLAFSGEGAVFVDIG
jgi:Flp pilus assembly protein TadD/uncharacterized protein (AIM24 family)